MWTLFLITVILVARNSRGDNQQQQCTGQWQSHDQCMQSRQSEYRRTSDLSSSDRSDMKAK
uniref:Uncharacterized protein n=1 Tax=Romanomermis culicivorax TaxID=13658 RepID=A0A915K4Q8_ROMCU